MLRLAAGGAAQIAGPCLGRLRLHSALRILTTIMPIRAGLSPGAGVPWGSYKGPGH